MTNAVLRKLAALVPLADRDLAPVVEMGRSRRALPVQTVLVAEGDPASGAFMIHDGWAARQRLLADGRRQIHGFLLPGDIAVADLPAGRAADHSIAALTQATVTPVAPERLIALMRGETRLGDALWRAFAHDHAVLREHIVSIGRRSAYERVSHLLLELRQRLAMVGLADGPAFEFPLTQAVLADALGLSVVHVHRILRRLEADGLVRQGTRAMTILDPEKLSAVAEFDEALVQPVPPVVAALRHAPG